MMAAGAAANNGRKVLLLEKNPELGKKLSITGGGRCNITNATFDVKTFLLKYGDAEPFLYSTFSQFGVQSTFDFFESRNLPLVTQARNRVFPASEKSTDVTKIMREYITHDNITVMTGDPVKKFRINPETSAIEGVVTKEDTFSANSYIIATGGVSHPETGSTGDGFSWLEKLGHTVKKSTPTIVPLRVPDRWVRDISGISLTFSKITFFSEGKKAFSQKGKILFTHFGLSGPMILNLAHKVADLMHTGTVTATIDCYPDTDLGALEKNILKVFDANKNKFFRTIAKDITPLGLSQTIIDWGIISPDTKVHSISKDERKKLVQLLKAMPLTITGLMGMDRAVISDGGVPLTEIDTRTMESKLVKGLYLTGDILHINRPSGGYSLQLCWTTGYVAGKSA